MKMMTMTALMKSASTMCIYKFHVTSIQLSLAFTSSAPSCIGRVLEMGQSDGEDKHLDQYLLFHNNVAILLCVTETLHASKRQT